MKFYIIYSFDCPTCESVKEFQPPKLHKWKLTEDDSCYEYDYLGGDWEKGKHRGIPKHI